MTPAEIRVGTAGWSIPRTSAQSFDMAGTHLQRYSRRLTCVEINSSFHRAHAPTTYAKWRDSTPPEFRFAVKLPKTITHERRLVDTRELLVAFLDQSRGLGDKRGPLLVQLPPSLAFDESLAAQFFQLFRELHHGAVVCEPRHATWFTLSADALLQTFAIGRVAADPATVAAAAVPGVWSDIAYFRLHGSPRTYWSRYDERFIATLAMAITGLGGLAEIWCVFDNTASGAASANALELSDQLQRGASSP